MEKNILVVVDQIPKFKLLIKREDKISDIKKSFEDYENYSIKMFLNKDFQLKIFKTNKYDDDTLESVWNQMKNPSIYLTTIVKTVKTVKFPKDVFIHITNFADDRTVLNMLSSNKNYNDPKFFKQILTTKYPMLIRFKKGNESWKNFYLRMIYYLSYIREKYNVPYINSLLFDPILIYKSRTINIGITEDETIIDDFLKNNGNLQMVLIGLSKAGNLKLFKKYKDDDFNPLDYIESSVISNNPEMLNYILKKANKIPGIIPPILFERILLGAAYLGDIPLFEKYYTDQVDYYYTDQVDGKLIKDIFSRAIRGKDIDMIKYLMEDIIREVIREEDIVKEVLYLVMMGYTDNDIEIIKYLLGILTPGTLIKTLSEIYEFANLIDKDILNYIYSIPV